MMRIILFLASGLCLSACPADMPPDTAQIALVKCPETRPEMCTMNYDPVCGILSDGSSKTYANGCNACSDLRVMSYARGECQ
jgi:hypothetical protein